MSITKHGRVRYTGRSKNKSEFAIISVFIQSLIWSFSHYKSIFELFEKSSHKLEVHTSFAFNLLSVNYLHLILTWIVQSSYVGGYASSLLLLSELLVKMLLKNTLYHITVISIFVKKKKKSVTLITYERYMYNDLITCSNKFATMNYEHIHIRL